MSYGILLNCHDCKRKEKCTDYKHIQDAVNTIHNQEDQAGHRGYGNITIDCFVNEPTKDLSFEQALNALKQLKKVARKGWNGKNAFIYFQTGSTVSYEALKNEPKLAIDLREKFEGGIKGSSRYISGHIDMVNPLGQIMVGWCPAQVDLFANDWYIVKEPVFGELR